MNVRRLALAGLALATSCSQSSPAVNVASSGKFLRVVQPVPGSYLVVLREGARPDDDSAAIARALAARHAAEVTHVYGAALRGFAAQLTEQDALALAAEPDVDFVEEDGVVHAVASEPNPPWGLDRIDQRTGRDGVYTYALTGAGVHAYVIDTGIRVTHLEFEGRAAAEFTAFPGLPDDCNGHGTHVAGTIGGRTYGVAKQVRLHAVQVLDCGGWGTDSQVIAGIDWVTAHHAAPAVANMSLGGSASAALDLAVQRSIASGVTYAIAAGNEAADACTGSPSRVAQAITVGALADPTRPWSARGDDIVWFSNVGPCVDVFAPGEGVVSAYNRSDGDSKALDGTSMASPHVAGAAALYLEANPAASPAAVARALAGSADTGTLVRPAPPSTTDRVLYTGFLQPPSGDGPGAALTAPSDGATISGTVTLAATASAPSGIAEVDFFSDGFLVGTDADAPYEVVFSTAEEETGAHALEVAAYDAAWRASPRSGVRVVIRNRGRSAPDPALAVPSCRSVESRCYTGRSLAGRGSGEWGSPNTIYGTCPDGDYGSWLADSSVERIEVRSADGLPFAPGREVIVRADWRAGSLGDVVDLFSAADAAAPVWAHRARAPASAMGPVATEWRFALPEGSWQAVRVAYRSELRTDASSTPTAPCSLDLFDDRDDLAFAVGDGVGDATAPVVSVTGPASAGIGVPTTLRAAASDDRAVRRVAFEVDDVLVGDALAEPFAAAWTPPGPGTFVVVARAWDAAGNEGVSAPFTVVVGDVTPPAIAWTSPSPWWGTAAFGGVATLAVAVQDVTGIVVRVEFLVDGAVVAAADAPPWQSTWDTTLAAEGLHQLVARAVDDSGNAAATAPRPVRVDRTPPSVAITSPSDGAIVSGSVPVTTFASDESGIATVALSADGVAFSASWDARAASPGPHVLRAKATDRAGNSAEASVTVVVEDVRPPTIWVGASPSAGDVTGGTTTLYASASDDVGVVRTELFVDGILVGAAAGSGFVSTTWSGAEGPHQILARATDAAGNVATAARTIEVDVTPPAVQVLAPAAGETLDAPTTVAVSISDAHAIALTELFVDGRPVASRREAPFDLPLDPRFVPSGAHVLTVRATDAAGNAATSADVPIEVYAPDAAVYDPALGVPRCATAGAACRAGFLIAESGATELHWPNTLGGAADDRMLTFSAIDAIEVATLDGSPLAAGRTVRLRLLLEGPESAKIFVATDPLLPAWQFVGQIWTRSWEASWYETTLVLPSAPVQAIRVANGVEWEPDPYSRYNSDYDDLVFAVAP